MTNTRLETLHIALDNLPMGKGFDMEQKELIAELISFDFEEEQARKEEEQFIAIAVDKIKQHIIDKDNYIYACNIFGNLLKAYDTHQDNKRLFNIIDEMISELDGLIHNWYYRTTISKFNAWCEKHIDGKSYEEIPSEDWDLYSDWYKDLYGMRPHWIRG